MAFKNLPPELALNDAIKEKGITLIDSIFEHYDTHGTFQPVSDNSDPRYIEGLMEHIYQALPSEYKQNTIDRRLREAFFLASKTAELAIHRRTPFMQETLGSTPPARVIDYDRGAAIVKNVNDYLDSNLYVGELIHTTLDVLGGNEWEMDEAAMSKDPRRMIAGYAFRAIDIKTHEEYSQGLRAILDIQHTTAN